MAIKLNLCRAINGLKFFPAIRAFEDFFARRFEMLLSPERHSSHQLWHDTVCYESIYGFLITFGFHAGLPPKSLEHSSLIDEHRGIKKGGVSGSTATLCLQSPSAFPNGSARLVWTR
jgi:hypothetical protein